MQCNIFSINVTHVILGKPLLYDYSITRKVTLSNVIVR